MTSQYKYFLIIEWINSVVKQKCIKNFYMPSTSLDTRDTGKTSNITSLICMGLIALYINMKCKLKQ